MAGKTVTRLALGKCLATSIAGILMASAVLVGESWATPEAGQRGAESGAPELPIDDTDLRKRDWILLPIPSVSPRTGFSLTAMGAYLYTLDEESKTSLSGIGVYASANGSWAVGVMQELNFAEDRFRLQFTAGYADFRYDFFGIGSGAGDAGRSIPIAQTGWLLHSRALFRVAANLYVGAQYRYLTATTRLRLDLPEPPPGFPELPRPGLKVDAGLLGLLVQFDSRDNEWNPTDGILFDAKFEIARNKLGNDSKFEALRLTFSHYIEFKPGHVLAYNAHLCNVWRKAPFFDLCQYGSANTLRGYEAGRYRDSAMIAVQPEYRWQLSQKFGAVFFAGIGAVAPSIGDFGKEGWLPSAGVGLRYVISEAFGINLGMDYARGRGSNTFYIRVGEAF